MRCIIRIALIFFLVWGYSCHFASKKQTTDTVSNTHLVVDNRSKESTTDKESTIDKANVESKVIFPGFTIKLNGFKVYNVDEQSGKSGFTGDSSKVKINIDENKIWTLKPTIDTLNLWYVGDENYYTDVMEFTPENKIDVFKISYSFEVTIFEPDVKQGIRFSEMDIYRPLEDSLNYFFRIPKSVYVNNYNVCFDDIKKHLKLRDTIVKYDETYDGGSFKTTEKGVIYENKACVVDPGNRIFLKIERYRAGTLMGTNFLTIDIETDE